MEGRKVIKWEPELGSDQAATLPEQALRNKAIPTEKASGVGLERNDEMDNRIGFVLEKTLHQSIE